MAATISHTPLYKPNVLVGGGPLLAAHDRLQLRPALDLHLVHGVEAEDGPLGGGLLHRRLCGEDLGQVPHAHPPIGTDCDEFPVLAGDELVDGSLVALGAVPPRHLQLDAAVAPTVPHQQVPPFGGRDDLAAVPTVDGRLDCGLWGAIVS